MNTLDLKTLLLGSSLLMSGFAFSTVAYAQEAPQDAPETIETDGEDQAEEDGDNIIVTGSRIKKTTFSSISPLQVITANSALKGGLIDPAQILQQDQSAQGTQIDATFQGFVLDNGPGSQTLNLRGLDATRTLVMINGRRVAPSGVEGAPVSASINFIPGSLVDRYDLLLDGASSVYGSDAIAGVANVILRKDFDGFELIGNVGTTEQGGNTDYTIAANWGGNNDRGFIGVGVEYDFRDEVTLADRDFLDDCEKHVEVTSDGEIRHRDIFDATRYSVWFNGFTAADGNGANAECVTDGISGRLIEYSGTFGSIYHVPGQSNIGIPGYVDQTISGVPIDANQDGIQDYGFQEFSVNGTQLDRSFISEQKRISMMAYGEYVLEGEMNLTPFFEAMYVDTKVFADAGQPLLFPFVGVNNPTNPCGVNGVDCGSNNTPFDQGFVDRWNTYQRDRDPNRDGDESDARICATFAGGAFDNANCTPFLFGYGPGDFVGPGESRPVVGVRGDRDQVNTTQKNIRLVGGFKGDLPQLNFASLSNWSFETSLVYSRSEGNSSRKGIRGDRLNFALGNDLDSGTPNGQAPCTAAPGVTVRADVLAGCVAVDMFADSLSLTTVGDFATQAERDYLFDDRTFNTVYAQTIWSSFITGNLMDLPAGPVGAVLGAEYRIDELDSRPGEIARDGLFFGFFSDSGAVGKKATREMFGEISIPILADKPLFRQLDIDLSGRLTDDEFYGTNYTYSIKSGWRPVDSLLLKASYGTSFRAPNLRENFLLGQSGFTNFSDPCVVPLTARTADINGGPDNYDSNGDQRDAQTIARCIAEGVNPTSLGLDPVNSGVVNAEISRSGSLNLDPESSNSLSLGFAFDQPFTDAFDLTLGFNYYRIEVNDSLIEPSGQFLINDCFARQDNARSTFCDRVIRDSDGFIDQIDAGFANIAVDLARGMDFNARFDKEFNAMDHALDFSIDFRAHRWLERSFEDLDDNGVAQSTEIQGEFGFPTWTGRTRFDLGIDDKWNLSWTTRFIDAVEQDADGIDDFGDALGTSGFTADTCGGVFVNDVTCRDVGYTDSYFVHSASVSYRADTWRVTAGASNVFNTEPPEVDGSEVLSISNVPIGNGYDLYGRRFFVNVRKSF